MILLDTHIWIWWVSNSTNLPSEQRDFIEQKVQEGICISMISLWEVAKKAEVGKLRFNREVVEWIDLATSYPGMTVLDLTKEILLESTRLPGSFHKDPADQMIVATSRIHNIPLLTADSKILQYEYVKLIDTNT